MEQVNNLNKNLYAVSGMAIVSLLATSAGYFGLLDSSSLTQQNSHPQLAQAVPMPLAIPNPPAAKIDPAKQLEDDKNLQAISKIINNIQKDIAELKQDVEHVSNRVDGLKEQLDGKRKATVTVSSTNTKNTDTTRKTAKSSNPNEFTILGANSEQLLISQGGETKKITVGSNLPNGAVFQGYDGKQIQTNLGVYLVE